MMRKVLEEIHEVDGFGVVNMGTLKERYPDKFSPGGSMQWEWFEKEIRPRYFIYYRPDKASLTFTLQDGPIIEVGQNGCQLDTLIAMAKEILIGLDAENHCFQNTQAIARLNDVLWWLDHRKKEREARRVEGLNES